MKRRITALLTILCMVLTMMPLHVHATEAGHVHYGGTATCKWKATCEGCGSIYGETDPNNHNDYFGEDNGDGRTHTAMCTCGHVYNASEAHDFSGWEEDGPGQEARFCYECYYTETRSTHTHNYSAATCTAPATCSCGATTGEVDSTNHTGGTEIRDAKAATEFEAGYTGDTYCKGCGDKLSSGSTIPPTHVHSYSTATCTTPATCSCGETTGDVDKSNHVGGTETRGYEAAGEFTDGYTGDTYCLGCGDLLSSGSVIPATHTHSWGWTYDSELHWEKCSSCGESSTAAQAHTFETVVIPPTATEEGGYVSICSVCNYEEHLHIYSDATCTTPATCSCGATQGDVDKSNHVGGTEIRNAKDASEFEAGYTGDTYCLGCGDKLADGQTIPATHQHSYTAFVTAPTCSEQGYTTYTCSCNDSYVSDYVDALGHDWGDYISNGNETHTRTCTTDSSHYQTEKCSGGTATCKDLATCSECGGNYGSLNSTNHSGGTEVRNAKAATETENGYSGDTYCLGCGIKISEGDTIPATGSGDDNDDTHTHNYSYYKYDGTNHWKMCHCGQGQAGSVKPHTLVIQSNNNGHWKECTVCNYSDIQAHIYSNDSDEICNDCGYNRHVHSFSTATCAAPATCSCGRTFGFTDSNNHTGGTEIRNAAEATIVAEGYTGDTYCKGCGAKLFSGEVIPKITQIFENTVTGIVTFIPAEGTELPEDAEVIVEDHTPSADNLAFLLLPETAKPSTRMAVVPEDIIKSTDAAVIGPDGERYIQHEKLLINGKEYYVSGSDDESLLLYDKAGNMYSYDGDKEPKVIGQNAGTEYPKNKFISINGAIYQIHSVLRDTDGNGTLILYLDGKPAGMCQFNQFEEIDSINIYNDDYHPAEVKERQQLSGYVGTVTPGENPIDGLESGKTYNVSVIGSNDIHLEGAENASGTVTQTFDIPNELVGKTDVTFVAVHNTNPHLTALAAAKYKMEETMIDYWEYHGDSDEERQRLYEAANRAAMEWNIVQEHYNAWEKEHATDAETGNELGAVTIAEDGKTLTATYTVNSFSPFTVYAFTEAELPEAKKFVTQPDGTLVRVVNGQPVITHTVASGENLTVIARKYGCTVDEIVALNSGLIENPSVISVGWVLMIPKK